MVCRIGTRWRQTSHQLFIIHKSVIHVTSENIPANGRIPARVLDRRVYRPQSVTVSADACMKACHLMSQVAVIVLHGQGYVFLILK